MGRNQEPRWQRLPGGFDAERFSEGGGRDRSLAGGQNRYSFGTDIGGKDFGKLVGPNVKFNRVARAKWVLFWFYRSCQQRRRKTRGRFVDALAFLESERGDENQTLDVARPRAQSRKLTLRVHDECNGSDVFGSDICTCRPYLIQGIEESIKTAQSGGTGIVAYFRKEGRALGEVTKFLVYNARKRQGDRADQYFQHTECVAGVQDARMQVLMPDVLHWLGVKRVDRLVSMSDHKYNAIVNSGIKVIDRIMLIDDLIPLDARVEIEAKKAAGYYSETI